MDDTMAITRRDDPTMIDRLCGPHEWGYRDPVEGGFVEDLTPFDAGHEITRLTAENERLREALEWYAEQVAGCRKITPEGNASRAALDADGGSRARSALTQGEPT